MRALKIHVTKEARFYRWEVDREFFRAGEVLTGHVEFDDPTVRPPTSTRVLWTDSYGRLVRSTPGKWDRKAGRLNFEFVLDAGVSMANWLEVELDGTRQARERFVIARPVKPWDEYLVFVWAGYPYGYYDGLRDMGVEGQIAYKRVPIDPLIENDFHCYVDQMSPDEVSAYHRPDFLYWENPKEFTRPERMTYPAMKLWDALRQTYKRAKARLGDRPITLDRWEQKLLWRASCLSDRGNHAKMRERVMTTVVQHKALRPAFYNMADEPGIGDQAAPFDFCYCKHCMHKFRSWLERRYGLLENLNRQWGTSFRLWREIVPMTTDDTMQRQAATGEFNFSSWADHREFMDDVFAGAFAIMREAGREVDPNAVFGSTGGQTPCAYGGWDYAKLVRVMDLQVPYNIGGNDELLRSLRPRIRKIAPYFGDDVRLVRRMWYQLFHGDCGQIHWDNNEPKGRFLKRPTRKPDSHGKVLGPTIRELTRGIAKQIMSMESVAEHLAVHHSQPSVRAHWMLGALPEGENWINRDSQDSNSAVGDRLMLLRLSAIHLAGDGGYPYRFSAYDALADGELDRDSFRAVYLPQSLAMSKAECQAVERFVRNGGVAVADALPAVMDEHCRLLPEGQLDALFGVRRSSFHYGKPGGQIVAAGGGPLDMEKGRLALHAVEPGLKAVGDAVAFGRAGKTDCLIVRRDGKGLAIYLNADLSGYHLWRFAVDSPRARDAQRLLAACLRTVGLRSEANLWSKAGGRHRRLPGVETIRFARGPVELLCAVAYEGRRSSGTGEEGPYDFNSFDHVSDIEVELPRVGHAYDSRTGKYHGNVDRFCDRFDGMDAKVYAMLPYRVMGLSADATGDCVVGEHTSFALRIDTDAGNETGRHVVRCDVFDPSGRWCSYYSKNVVTDGGRGEMHIPFAEDDRPGAWRLELRDAVSGQKATVRLKVASCRKR